MRKRNAPSLFEKRKRGFAKSDVSKVLFPGIGKITNRGVHKNKNVRRELFCRKAVLKILGKFTGKH